MTSGMGASKSPEEGTVSIRHCLFEKLPGNGWPLGAPEGCEGCEGCSDRKGFDASRKGIVENKLPIQAQTGLNWELGGLTPAVFCPESFVAKLGKPQTSNPIETTSCKHAADCVLPSCCPVSPCCLCVLWSLSFWGELGCLKRLQVVVCLIDCLIVCLLACLFACLLVCLFDRLFASLIVCLFVCLLVCLFVCLLVCLFACSRVCLIH